MTIDLTRAQRIGLWLFSGIGLIGINGAFLYAVCFRPEHIQAIQTNFLAMAFVIEAFLLLGLFCVVVHLCNLRRPGWRGFLALSLLGSLAFSIPLCILLWSRSRGGSEEFTER